MATVEAVFEELNFPSAPRLKRVLAARGIPFNNQEVDRLVRGETTRQVQAPTYKFEGKIASSDLNSRWFADLIDFTAAPSADTGKDVGLRPTASGENTFWSYRTSLAASCMQRRSWTSALPLWLLRFRRYWIGQAWPQNL